MREDRVMDMSLRKPLAGSTMTVNLTVAREFKARMFIGKLLLRLAARVLGGDSQINVDDISALRLGPEDKIVFKVKGSLAPEQADQIKRIAKNIFGERDVLVLDAGTTIGVIRIEVAGPQ